MQKIEFDIEVAGVIVLALVGLVFVIWGLQWPS